MSRHTPGPWTVSGDLVCGAPEARPNPKVEPHPHVVCKMAWNFDGDRGATGDLPWSIAQANQHLIAAAPDLLAACRLALSLHGNDQDAEKGCPSPHELAADLRNAIAKATGGDA